MLKLSLRITIVILLCLKLASCGEGNVVETEPALALPQLTGATPWTDKNVLDDSADFHFAVVSDRTCCARAGVFARAMPKVNLLAPAFVVSVGDLIEGYTENQNQLEREWDEIEAYVDQLDAQFFYAPGNHDMNNAVMAREWQRRFGPSYYHFHYKDVLFLVLNSELFGMVGAPDTPVPGPWKQSDQMDFVRSVLAQNPNPRWTMVLLHQPLWAAQNINPDWLEVEELLGTRGYTVFAGHNHQYSLVERNNRNFITLATTGGGSDLRGTAFGEFDHVAWVAMRGDRPIIGNVLLDGIQAEDVSNPEMLSALTAISESVDIEIDAAEGPAFKQAAARVTLHNPTAAPLSMSPSVVRKTNFEISGLLPLTIPPGESKEMFIRLEASDSLPYAALKTAAIQWTVTGTVGERPVQFPVVKPVLPLSTYPIGLIGDVQLDGLLDEWGTLKYVVEQQGDILSPDFEVTDASYRFDVREGVNHLYVAIDVTDDDVRVEEDLIPRSQDSIRLFIDPRAPERRNASMSAGAAALGGDMAAQVATIVAIGEVLEDELLGFVAETNAAIEYKVVITSKGYSAEFAVPMSYILAKAKADDPTIEDWDTARISVGIYDLDEGEHQGVPLFWQPYRYGNAAVAGSETFVRTR